MSKSCVWASYGLGLHNSGRGYLCCQSRTYLQDNNQQDIYWHTHTLDAAWNSTTRTEIIDALAQGTEHPNCQACWDAEHAGILSRRQASNSQFANIIEGTTPKLIDLKLGNTCNLSCRWCWPEVSSKWMNDYYEVFEKQSGISKQDYKQRWKPIQLSYSEKNEPLWTDLKQYLQQAEYIDIYGAEPFLLKRLWETLGWLKDNNYSQNQSIHINTNATIWNDEYIDILKSFKHVQLDLSIDAIGKQFEYIRNGETWNTLEQNLVQFKELLSIGNINVNVCITVGILNMYYLDEIIDYFENCGLGYFINYVHMPEFQCVRFMPNHIKAAIEEKLDTNKRFVQDAISFMNLAAEESDKQWQEFLRSTHELDKIRNQSFKDAFPEFARLL
jgi:sulfatase maturation enzyme AslB (radical SAM superfamily)